MQEQKHAPNIQSIFKVKPNELQRQAFEVIRRTNRNVLVSAPTGSGKTLIGYYALLHHGGGFYLAPLISLMMEKYFELSSYLKPHKISVLVSNRDYRIPTNRFLKAHIKIMSPYRFLSLAREIDPIEHGNVVVIDEIHKIHNDPLVEASITMAKKLGLRIIGLSATIHEHDREQLARWLNAIVIHTKRRPVPLEYTSVNLKPYGIMLLPETKIDNLVIPKTTVNTREEASAYIAQVIHALTKQPVIVWAPTRAKVQQIAKLIASNLPLRLEFQEIANRIPASNTYERALKFTIKHGVFIHHGGLSATARGIVERAYREYGGVLVTAYTLSHGVNLPARYLILSSIYGWNGEPLTPTVFHQIAGRAGRPSFDEKGTVIVITVGEAEQEYYNKILIATKATRIHPTLLEDTRVATKTALPFTLSKVNIRDILSDTYSYVLNPDDRKIEIIEHEVEKVLDYYKNIPQKEAHVAISMGLYPDEYEIIKLAITRPYDEAIDDVLIKAGEIYPTTHQALYQVRKYGFLATILATHTDARNIANILQMILEAGVHFAGKVWGWKSREYEQAVDFAKKFAYAGNPRVEPLSREVSIPAMRRMLKAVPALLLGASGTEAGRALIVAVREAFLYWKYKPKKKVERVAKLAWYAITGQETLPQSLLQSVFRELYRGG